MNVDLHHESIFNAIAQAIQEHHTWIRSGKVSELSHEFLLPGGVLFATDDKGSYFQGKRIEISSAFWQRKQGRAFTALLESCLGKISGKQVDAKEVVSLRKMLSARLVKGSCFGQAMLSMIRRKGKTKETKVSDDILFFQLLVIARYAAKDLFGRVTTPEQSSPKVQASARAIHAMVEAHELAELSKRAHIRRNKVVEVSSIDELKKSFPSSGSCRLTFVTKEKVHTAVLFLDSPYAIFNSQAGTISYSSREGLLKDTLGMLSSSLYDRTHFTRPIQLEFFQ